VRLPSVVATAYYSQSLPIADIIYFNPPAKNKIGAAEEKTLIDLVRARPEAADDNWQGFEGDDLQVVLDLGEKKDVYELELSLLEDNNAGIFLPAEVKIELSLDGKKFETVVEQQLPQPEAGKSRDAALRSLAFGLRGRQARFIRLTATNIGTVPAGFRRAGRKAWLLVDEIYVR